MVEDQYTMIKKRQESEAAYFANLKSDDILSSISSIDITTIDLCNRDCVFCPRHDPKIYPNRNLWMTAEGAAILGEKISVLNYTGTIGISGFGENLLNPEIMGVIRALKTSNPKAFVEVNTNGDPLTLEMFNELIESGVDILNINLYDGPEQVEKFDEMLGDLPGYRYRVHYNPDDFGILYNNRSGMIDWLPSDPKELAGTPCYLPFYKLMIDWNGDVLFCANDWGKERVVGNLFQQSIMDVWMSKGMRKVRMRLAKGNRDFSPCKTCNVKGTLVGEQSFKMLKEHYSANRSNR